MSTLCLLARIAGVPVAIPSAAVEAVVDIDAIVPVPAAPAPIAGLSALRSRIVTVIDAALALGEAPSQGARAIVVALDGHDYALLVDAVDDVAPFAVDALANGLALSPAWRSAATGMVSTHGETMLAIDPYAIVRAASQAARAA